MVLESENWAPLPKGSVRHECEQSVDVLRGPWLEMCGCPMSAHVTTMRRQDRQQDEQQKELTEKHKKRHLVN